MTPDGDTPLVRQAEVDALASALREAGVFALDVEFISEERYVPALALVQVAWEVSGVVEAAAVDPLRTDVRPVAELLAADEVTTVMHSAQADLALLAHEFGVAGHGIVDTQIAAAFLGMGEQIGYAPLVHRVLGIEVDKAGQFTEWLRRPLDADQVQYALDDVRHLLPLWHTLEEMLDERGRTEWVVEESAALADTWAARTPPEEMYRRVRGWNSLRPRQQGALRALAAWRERESLRLNRPPSRLMNDRTLLEVARRSPLDTDALRSIRGMPEGVVRQSGHAILTAVREGVDRPVEADEGRRAPSTRAQVWSGMLAGLVQAYCRDAEIAARFVAARSEIDALAEWWSDGDRSREPDLPMLHGWRRTLVGEHALAWLAGRTVIRSDETSPLGIRIEAVEPPPAEERD